MCRVTSTKMLRPVVCCHQKTQPNIQRKNWLTIYSNKQAISEEDSGLCSFQSQVDWVHLTSSVTPWAFCLRLQSMTASWLRMLHRHFNATKRQFVKTVHILSHTLCQVRVWSIGCKCLDCSVSLVGRRVWFLAHCSCSGLCRQYFCLDWLTFMEGSPCTWHLWLDLC